jgi:hypothetical protein
MPSLASKIEHAPAPLSWSQQSASDRHSSPAGRHPPSSWQTTAPEALAAHTREQHWSCALHVSPATPHALDAAQNPPAHT